MKLRSLLYVPGNEPHKVEKAGALGADAVILDLEDAVPAQLKEATRPAVRQAIPAVKAQGPAVCVRINPTRQKTDFSIPVGVADLEAIVCAELDGVVVPKVESAQELLEVDAVLTAQERQLGLPVGSVQVVPIVETAVGLWNAYEIARSTPRIHTLHLGAGDLTRDLRIELSRDEGELLYGRSHVVLVSRAAGLEPPADIVWLRLDDDAGFAESVQRGKRLGFFGKTCIHPKQVPIVNQAYSPSAEEVVRAKKVVEAFAEAQARGSASITVDGQFVDYPVAEKAEQVLKLHAQTTQGKPQGAPNLRSP